MIIPSTSYSGKVASDPTNYPYGKARNVTVSGDGTGTPWEAAFVNDLYGLLQAAVDEAGVTPSGSPETIVASQVKESLRTIFNMRTVTHDMASDADYTLTADQNRYRRVVITDTGVLLTVARNIVVDDSERMILVQNDTLQILTFKTPSGTGIAVNPGVATVLYCDGTNVVILSQEVGVNQTWQDVSGSRAAATLYTNTTGKPIEVIISAVQATTNSLIIYSIDGLPSIVSQGASATTNRCSVSFIVPNGSTYIASTLTGTITWLELR